MRDKPAYSSRSEMPGEVLRKIAHNPATAEVTLEHLIDLDQRWPSIRPLPRRPQRRSPSGSVRWRCRSRDHAGMGNREWRVDRARLLEPSADSSQVS